MNGEWCHSLPQGPRGGGIVGGAGLAESAGHTDKYAQQAAGERGPQSVSLT